MTLLAINWSETAVKAAEFIVSFSIIVVLHELGHFLPAKYFKCRVEKFYLFFNPYFSLFKKKIGETEYGLGWVPFGGYVKISGMIDESMDKDAMKLPPKDYEFRSKPAWQRLIIMVGGVTVNLLLGFFLFAMILWYYGDTYIPTNGLKYGISTDSLGKSIGLMGGDRIVSLDGKPVEKLGRIPVEVILSNVKTIQVDRDGKNMSLPIPDDFAANLIHFKSIKFLDVRYPLAPIDSLAKGSAAEKAGLMKNDKVFAVNGSPVPFYDMFIAAVTGNKNKEIEISLLRGGDTINTKAFIPKEGTLGVYHFNNAALRDSSINWKTVPYTFVKAIPAGLKVSGQTLEDNWIQLKLLFSGKVKSSESLGSVISIGKLYPEKWDWHAVWNLTALFSLVLALMNILPIPALDGGHVMFTLYEMISGRKPSDKFIEYAQLVGMVLILGLTAYALGLDIFRLFKK